MREMKTNCLKCKYHKPGECTHPKSKAREFWNRPVGECPYFEKNILPLQGGQEDDGG